MNDPKFEIYLSFPSGYKDTDCANDNIDVNVGIKITNTIVVYSATLFTLENVRFFTEKFDFFWTKNMIILNNLNIETIHKVIARIVEEEELLSMQKIGEFESLDEFLEVFDSAYLIS